MILKKIIYVIFANLININLYFIKKFSKKKIIYSSKISFGDTFLFYIHNYFKISKNKINILIFSKLEKKIAEFFFNKKNIINTFLLIPNFVPVYGINFLLKKKKYFAPDASFEINYKKRKILNKYKILLTKLLKKKITSVSPELKKIQNEKFILMFIKYYNNRNDITYGSNSRQTLNFNKIYRLMNLFLKKKIKIVILGNKSDKSIPILKRKYDNNNNVVFFKDISLKESICDQLFVHYYSSLSIGSDSGAFIMSQYLKKKIFFFDALADKDQSYQKFKNIKILYKKIIYNKKIEKLSSTHLNNMQSMKIKYLIKENSFFEIKNELKKTNYKL